MENTEKFRMRKYSKQTARNIYAAPMRGVNKNYLVRVFSWAAFSYHSSKFLVTIKSETFYHKNWDKIWNL